MAHQDLVVVVALVLMAIIGAFATDLSPSPAAPKASSPSNNSPSFSSSNFDGGAPNSSPSGALPSSSSSLGPSKINKQKTKNGSSPDSESPEEVSFPPLPTTIFELFDSLSPSPKNKDVDSENLGYSEDSLTPTSSNVDVVNATSAIGVAIVVGFFLFYA
ncbi:hypothetical protein GQ457_01G029730 [Hibiscus cannabinus]